MNDLCRNHQRREASERVSVEKEATAVATARGRESQSLVLVLDVAMHLHRRPEQRGQRPACEHLRRGPWNDSANPRSGRRRRWGSEGWHGAGSPVSSLTHGHAVGGGDGTPGPCPGLPWRIWTCSLDPPPSSLVMRGGDGRGWGRERRRRPWPAARSV